MRDDANAGVAVKTGEGETLVEMSRSKARRVCLLWE